MLRHDPLASQASTRPSPPQPNPGLFCAERFCAEPPENLSNAQDGGDNQQAVREDPPSPGDRGYNVFRNLVLHGLKDELDFEVVYNGLSRLLNNLHRSRNTYIPGAATEVGIGGWGALG